MPAPSTPDRSTIRCMVRLDLDRQQILGCRRRMIERAISVRWEG